VTQPQPKTRDQRARELSRLSKRDLAAMCRDGIRAPDGGLVCVEGAYPVITWDKHDIINSILSIEHPAMPAPQPAGADRQEG
jgi:hypothetical protein